MIDLRSDTATKPTPEMLAAMAAAERRRRAGAARIRPSTSSSGARPSCSGTRRALFLPTATMANQIALRVLTRPGTQLIAEERTHILDLRGRRAGGALGPARAAAPGGGRADHAASRCATVGRDRRRLQPAGIVVLEQTHRSAGGRVWPLDELAAVIDTARELGLAVHLDGARLINASVASGIPAAEYGRLADTVQICFSKGLGCPMGAILAGSEGADRGGLAAEVPVRRRAPPGRRRRGGDALRARPQRRAARRGPRAREAARRRRSPARASPSTSTRPRRTSSASTSPRSASTRRRRRARIAEQGVLVGLLRPGVLRVATHLGVTDDDVDRAIELIPRALGASSAA